MSTREITYVGTHRAVWIGPSTRVARGDSVEVPSELADELLARTEKGVEQWKPKAAPKKAAADKKSDDPSDDTPTDADKEA